MSILFANNVFGKLQAGITDIQLTLTLQSGDGANFPSPTGGDYFFLTVVDASANREIMKCTSRTGDVLTITRGEDNSSSQAFLAGDVVEMRVNAGILDDLQTQIDDITDGSTESLDTLDTRLTTAEGTLSTHVAATGTAVHGLGTMSTQASTSVAITGGTVSGITGSIAIDNESADVSIKARDHGSGSTPEVANVIFGTGSPPTASTVPEGTLFIKYTV